MKVLTVQNNIEFKGNSTIPSKYKAFIDNNLKEQIEIVTDVLQKVYLQLPKLSEDFLKKHGIEKVYNTLEKGITIQGEYIDYIISLHKNNDFRIRLQNKINKLIRERVYMYMMGR